MLDRIRDIFQQPPEQESVHIETVVDRFEEEHADRITAVQEQESALRDDIHTVLDDVEDALQTLKQYDHDKTRIDDVTTNVAEDRLRRIATFDAPDDPQQLYTALDALIDDIRQVSRKEQAVLDHIEGPANQVFRQIDTLEDQADRLEQFLDTDYAAVQAREELDDLLGRWHRLREERDRLEQELGAVDTETLRTRIQETDDQLAELADDPEQERKEKLGQELSDLETRRDSLQQEVAEAASAMERGLKKLLYATRNGDLSLSHEHAQVLETIRDGRITQEFTTPAADVADAVDAALDHIDQVDLGDRQQQKFQDGAETLRDLDTIRGELEAINDQIAAKQEGLADLSIDDRRDRLEQERNRLQNTLQERIQERQTLEERIQQKEQAIADVRQEIESLLNDHLHNDITVEPTDDGG